MASRKPRIEPAANPKHSLAFDAYNATSHGHQRAENTIATSIGWRESRVRKLASQFKSNGKGGKRISDLVGAGSEDWDEATKTLIPKNLRRKARNFIVEVGKPMPKAADNVPTSDSSKTGFARNAVDLFVAERDDTVLETTGDSETPASKRGIFDGLNIFLNGSTYPTISDHKLKRLLVENGANISIHLGRRQVTHVILGKPNKRGGGSGGGLAGTKIQKEIKAIGGAGVKYVGVEWVIESLQTGKRLPEARFKVLDLAHSRQPSVYGIFKGQQ